MSKGSKTFYMHGFYKKKGVYLHRIIMEKELGRKLNKDEKVDHINENGLDNRVSNLRVCTHAENCANRRKYRLKNPSSPYKGITKYEGRKKPWNVRIMINYKTKSFGYYQCPIVAAKVYDKNAKEIFGRYANTNF